MSYDVSLSAGNLDANYTSNMRGFFIHFGAWPGDWDGVDRQEVGRQIGEALRKIANADREHLESFNAPNGWGDWEGATRFLIQVWEACTGPDTVSVWR